MSKEVDRLFPTGKSAVARFEPDGAALVVVGFDQPVAGVVVGSRWELDDSMAATAVYRAGRAARMDDVDWSAVEAPIAVAARQIGPVSTVAGPIMVEGRLWGVVIVTAGEPLPVDTGERLEKFTELVATAIANAEAREELQRLADEQAALRRVATLVANEAPREEVFNAIAEGIGTLLEAEEIRMLRYEGGDSVVEEAGWGRNPSLLTLGVRHSLKGDGVTARVLRTGKPARMDDFDGAPGEMAAIARANRLRSAVGIPILVDGRVWGAMVAGALEPDMLPLDTDARLGQFTELMATAIANTESRAGGPARCRAGRPASRRHARCPRGRPRGRLRRRGGRGRVAAGLRQLGDGEIRAGRDGDRPRRATSAGPANDRRARCAGAGLRDRGRAPERCGGAVRRR